MISVRVRYVEIPRVGLENFKTGFNFGPQATRYTNNDVEGYVIRT